MEKKKEIKLKDCRIVHGITVIPTVMIGLFIDGDYVAEVDTGKNAIEVIFHLLARLIKEEAELVWFETKYNCGNEYFTTIRIKKNGKPITGKGKSVGDLYISFIQASLNAMNKK
jgi:hypothetical protein